MVTSRREPMGGLYGRFSGAAGVVRAGTECWIIVVFLFLALTLLVWGSGLGRGRGESPCKRYNHPIPGTADHIC